MPKGAGASGKKEAHSLYVRDDGGGGSREISNGGVVSNAEGMGFRMKKGSTAIFQDLEGSGCTFDITLLLYYAKYGF